MILLCDSKKAKFLLKIPTRIPVSCSLEVCDLADIAGLELTIARDYAFCRNGSCWISQAGVVTSDPSTRYDQQPEARL